jgi:hypothetical protein
MTTEQTIRLKVKEALEKVTAKNSPKIHAVIQSQDGYKVIEELIITKMCQNNGFTASACIPHVEKEM